MAIKKTSFYDIPTPSHISQKKTLKVIFMNKITQILGNIIDKRQRRFNSFAENARRLQEKSPAVYTSQEVIDKMSSKCYWMGLSEEDFVDLNKRIEKFAREKAEATCLLDQELYYKYTRLFFYSYKIRIINSLSKIF